MRPLLISLLAGSLLLAACTGSANSGTPSSPSSNTSIKTLQAPTSAELQAVQDSGLAQAQTRFGLDLFRQVVAEKPNQNHFISPLSVAIALGMVYNGATGTTRQEMAKTLQIEGMDLAKLNQAQLTLRKRLMNQGSGVRIDLANAIWARKGTEFNPNFLKTNQDFFNARTTALDFADPLSVQTINAWASDNTQGKIPKVIDKIDAQTLMLLMNAIYFKGSWNTPFEKSQTQDRAFKDATGKTSQTAMMRRYGKFRYLRDSGQQFQAVALPYGQDKSVNMVVFLPDPESKSSEFLNKLTASQLEDWLSRFRSQDGEVVLPRFKLEYEVGLNQVLKNMGMEMAFDESRADFSDLISSEKAFISQVKQNSFVEVNEEGTEAAAVTTVTVGATSVQLPQEPFSFVADHPFVYLIYDQTAHSILFSGVLNTLS
ncbi:proteinase inhibitor I4 serpin [bacterium (Candidatus Blackallbacteria) CG17_big_fil_post_rev_8_21_14_2_50_48_46]|uniref:Proteinase inhibitor I4 serpin n=1 Tax=bacterium (Candidatus Blackallbacteria) CG17_big_fil_post_rev_8_21_14_2_50_48_46 TaxID=2014261 RepID=A0A2M7G103_9BACT|nr:MAG: proteinase inhibitor I4 serpin [bacterium (Candidatus Blackallbacteria) CG18_big_fil_WC_8_21_14_2_50_49_26]PIW15326.1 MAG: proteinase inhibitor I4 serpin [bacterium (Candidatus Blackallbacteria) CG17_big_fil_post_rev_8_21_14_2_50_48_46]PIW45163.1 MAG: proteinase inhibitor I4 serpin [bacterium (Candidatus Blackallbacteria) CG13_big_fil_rev_8_21_14_2_50_49_14]